MAVRALYNGAVTFSLQRAPSANTKAQSLSRVTLSSAWHQRIPLHSLIVRYFSGSGDFFSRFVPHLPVSLRQSDHKPYRSRSVKATPLHISDAIVYTLRIFFPFKKNLNNKFASDCLMGIFPPVNIWIQENRAVKIVRHCSLINTHEALMRSELWLVRRWWFILSNSSSDGSALLY